MQGISGLFFLLIGLLAIGLQRLYSAVPLRELKRVAAGDDFAAKRLYMVAAYGESARLALWLAAAAGMSLGIVLLVPGLPGVVTFVLMGVVLLAALVWLPSIRLSKLTCQIAVWVAPGLAWMLGHAQPVLRPLAAVLNRYRRFERHSQVYEKDDLAALLDQQKEQFDNRIELAELERLKQGLLAADRQAADVVVPRKEVRTVGAHESLGPVLIGELHKTGQTTIPVIDEQSQELVGTLALHDAVAHAKQSGRVADVMRPEICFVHEDYSLLQTLEALLKTGQQLAVVVNGFEEYVGVVHLQTLVREVTGSSAAPADEKGEEINNLDRAVVAKFKPPQPASEQSAEQPDVADEASADPAAPAEIEPEDSAQPDVASTSAAPAEQVSSAESATTSSSDAAEVVE